MQLCLHLFSWSLDIYLKICSGLSLSETEITLFMFINLVDMGHQVDCIPYCKHTRSGIKLQYKGQWQDQYGMLNCVHWEQRKLWLEMVSQGMRELASSRCVFQKLGREGACVEIVETELEWTQEANDDLGNQNLVRLLPQHCRRRLVLELP